jgi:BON domain-containing protein
MKNHAAVVYTSLLAAILVLGVACAKKPNDAQMTADITQKFGQDSGLSTKPISVQANDGVVTLTGTVDNTAQREAAARQAAAEPGVKTVINNLQVGDSMAAAATPPAEQTPPPQAASEPAPVPAPEEKPDSGTSKKSKARSHQDRAPKKSSHDSDSQQMAANNPPPANPAPAPQDNMTPAPAAAPTPPPPPRKFIIDQGTQLSVRLTDAIDSEKNQTGDTFHGTLNTPITSDGEEAVPAGVDVVGHLVSVKSAGKFAGQSEVVLQVDSISSGGRTFNVQTDQYKKTASSRGKNTAEKVGGGALVGTIIGALAGGGKGAAIGAAAGAGVGGGVQAATKSQQIKLPSETVLNFTLQSPVTVVEPRNSSNRQKLGDSQQP